MGNSCTKPTQKSDSTALSKVEEVRFSNYHLGEDNNIQQGITTVKSKAADELTDTLIYGDEPDTDGKISAYNEADESATEPGSPETTGVEDQEPRTPLSPSSTMLEFRQPSSPTQSTPYKSNSAVKVALVVRPLFDWDVKTELDPLTKQPSTRGHKSVAVVLPPSKVRITVEEPGRPVKYDEYEFDRVYSASPGRVASKGLNTEMVAPVLVKYFAGFNATVLAYGQTGSGKTYTMGTTCGKKELASSHPSNPVIPWALQELFKYLGEATKTHEVTLLLSYIEIYKENIHDLLLSPLNSTTGRTSRGGSLPPTPAPPPTERLDVKMRPGGELYVAGALEVAVTSQEHLISLLERGNNLRSTAAHKLNAHSSRSHAIVTLRMEQRVRASAIEEVDSERHFLRSKLHLVDLAGSERLDDTGAEGLTMEEGIKINKGLHVLGKVIEALTDRERVPYRESMLTKVLQDSLGGNSETLFIACISPSDSNVGHTLSTLRYASRAMKIENVVTLNNYLSPEEEIAYLKGALSHAQMSLTREQARSAKLAEQLAEQQEQVARLTQLLQERGVAEQSGPGTPTEPSCGSTMPSQASESSRATSERSGSRGASGPGTQGADSSSAGGPEADAPASAPVTEL